MQMSNSLGEGPRTERQKGRSVRITTDFLQEQKEKHPLEMTAGELLKLQQEDKTFEAVHQAAKGGVSTAGRGFFERDVLIYRRWTPPGQDQGEVIIDQHYPAHVGEQYCSWHMQSHWLVTWEERKPLSEFSPSFNGLMSSKMLKNSEEFCTCTECQKTAPGKKTFAPLISLRIIEEPF